MACLYCMEAPEEGKCVRDGCFDCCNCGRVLIPWPESLRIMLVRLGWSKRFKDPYGVYFKKGLKDISLIDEIERAEKRFTKLSGDVAEYFARKLTRGK